MKDKVKAGYNQAAQAYQAGRDPFKNDRYLEKLNGMLEPNSLILDLGCGSGRPVDAFLIARGHRVIGLDFSEAQIQLVREKAARSSSASRWPGVIMMPTKTRASFKRPDLTSCWMKSMKPSAKNTR